MKRSIDDDLVSTALPPRARRSRLELPTAARVEFFATHGYAVVPDVLSSEELRALQRESSLLYQHAQDADEIVEQVAPVSLQLVRLSPSFEPLESLTCESFVWRILPEQGCVLDVMAECPVRASAAAWIARRSPNC